MADVCWVEILADERKTFPVVLCSLEKVLNLSKLIPSFIQIKGNKTGINPISAQFHPKKLV